MTFNQTSSIRFSVEESVWFKKGQEVSDLLAMSLDPEITVQEHDDYISIRGALVLTGEYYPHATEAAEDKEVFSLRDVGAYRTVDEVIESDGGIHSMTHRFPIDITIPTNRIRSLEDVYVLIEAFDYEIPERGRLELKADLCISGIANEREANISNSPNSNADVAPEVPSQALDSTNTNRNDEEQWADMTTAESKSDRKSSDEAAETIVTNFPSFATEVRKMASTEENNEEEEKENNRVQAEATIKNIEENQVTNEIAKAPELEKRTAKVVDKEESNQKQPSPSQEPVFEEKREENIELEAVREADLKDGLELEAAVEADTKAGLEREAQIEHEVPVTISSRNPSPQVEMKGRSEKQEKGWNPRGLYSLQQTTYNSSRYRESIEATETQEEMLQRSKRTENALYLTKMLSSDGEEDFSKLRIRIVQSGESLGTIAESYDISTNQIIRLNGLNDDVIQEGQILYIPEYAGVEK